MIQPFLRDEALLNDMLAFDSHDAFRVWWLGQSGFLIKYLGRYLLFDPYLSDSLTVKYAATDKPHVRMSAQAITPGLLPAVDVVTSSHNHTDHLDRETLLPILQQSPGARLVIPEANRAFVSERLGCDAGFPVGLNDGKSVTCGLFTLHGVPAAHNELERDAQGQCRYMGFVAVFGPFRVYHSGDTLWYDGMEALLRPFDVDIAFLPINGNKPERRVAGNLNADEAARLGVAIGARCVIPHHYHLFEFNTEDPERFVEAAERHRTSYRVLQIGEGATFVKKAE